MEFALKFKVARFLIDYELSAFSSTNNVHLTDKVEFSAQIYGILATSKFLLMKSFVRLKMHIETFMWKIQRMQFMVAGQH